MTGLLSYLAALPLLTQILITVCLVAIAVVGGEVIALRRKARQFQLVAHDLQHPEEKSHRRPWITARSFDGLKWVLEGPLRLLFGKAQYPWEEILVMYLFLAGVALTGVWLVGLLR
ncbi:MAG: hypothetical protein IPL49_17555 [Saprospirales bacterium]|nr:hypothetical protein [Saprospirales bacterium]